MKRNMKVMMFFIGLVLLFSSPAFAAPESTTLKNTAAVADPDVELSAGDTGAGHTPAHASALRLTPAERLTLQNAVCALWHNSMKQNPDAVANIDPMTLEGPEHIFVDPSSNVYFENGEWIFEGLIRQMAPDNTGIEVISGIQYYNVRFKKLENGRFQITSVHFDHVGGF